MIVHINYLAVLVGGVASMAIGSLYYADALYGKDWKKLSGIDSKKFSKEMPKLMPLIFIAALITAYFVAFFTYLFKYYYQSSWIAAGVETSLILWLGLSATTLYIHNVLDQKSSRLTLINLGNRLLSILAMGLIIGWLHP